MTTTTTTPEIDRLQRAWSALFEQHTALQTRLSIEQATLERLRKSAAQTNRRYPPGKAYGRGEFKPDERDLQRPIDHYNAQLEVVQGLESEHADVLQKLFRAREHLDSAINRTRRFD